MKNEVQEPDHRSVTKFQITKGQWVIAFLALISILALGFSSLVQSNATVKESSKLSNVETPAASIIFTQRETLVYATRLAQWSNGGTTRREVQIARSILAQRLAVIDTSGHSMGSRAKSSYWAALNKADAIVATAPVGVLPESVHMRFSGQISPIINDILNEARKLVVAYQRNVDVETRKSTRDAARRDQISLILFYLSLFFGCLFLLLNVRSNFKNYRVAGKYLEEEQKRLDKTLKELQLARSTVTELQNVNDAKNAFIATVNHELRTPLTSIIGYIDIIREENENASADLHQYLDVLDRNAQILLNLVESMLTLSKIDSNKSQPALERVWLNEVIDNSIFTMKPLAVNSGITINLEAKDDYFVVGDAGQLTQVFINLLGNAVKFSPRGSTVEIAVDSFSNDKGESLARISVTDSGIGIPAEDMEHLFTRFFRAHNAVSEHFQGTGLGLSIVAQVIKSHNGVISVTSEEGKGTTFVIEIPLHMNSEEKMIHDRRGAVLKRAITSLEGSSPESIKAITHDIGGALGFYRFSAVGADILEYSRTLNSQEPPALSEFTEAKNRFLEQLQVELQQLQGADNG